MWKPARPSTGASFTALFHQLFVALVPLPASSS